MIEIQTGRTCGAHEHTAIRRQARRPPGCPHDAPPPLGRAYSRIVNVASVPQRSPLRYPGGKTWLVPLMRGVLGRLPAGRPWRMCEPFAGGGSISLMSVAERHVAHALMVEKDVAVSALWRVALRDSRWLADRIRGFAPSAGNVHHLLASQELDDRSLAFRTLVRNRVSYGGILAAGASVVKAGENGRGMASRWYPKTLARRVADISALSPRIAFEEGDGMDAIRRRRRCRRTVFFIDPPYTAAGKRAGRRLYDHCEVDHDALFERAAGLAGVVVMTYDESDEVRRMARRHGLRVATAAMKNGHHERLRELVITNW